MSMDALVFLGVGQIIGSFVSGKVYDVYGSKKGTFYNLLMFILANTVTIMFLYQLEYNNIVYVMPFLWGL
jgi:predicted MFS family arabinose efflux permease